MILCALILVVSCSVSNIAVVEGVACKTVTLAQGESVLLHHPNYPKLSPAKTYCVSNVFTSSSCNWLKVDLKRIEINRRHADCSLEYLKIDGHAPGYTTRRITISRKCHYERNKKLTVRFPRIRVIYRARSMPRRWGFLMKVTAVSSQCCKVVDLDTVGKSLSMKTPGTSWHYNPSSFCYWKTQNAITKRVIDISCNSFAKIASDDVFKFTYGSTTIDVSKYTDLDGYEINALENFDIESYFISDEDRMGDDVSCTITLKSTYKRFNTLESKSEYFGSTILTHSTYPDNYTDDAEYYNKFTIFKDNTNICYFKLTFDHFHIGDGASKAGACTIDYLESQSGDCPMPTVCGITTDGSFHLYMHVTDSAVDKCKFQVTVNDAAEVSYDRFFKFTLENIACGAAHAPPDGCIQFYTASSGTVKSPMFQDENTVINAGLDYKVCIEQGSYTQVTWEVTSGLTRPFMIGDDLSQSGSCTDTYVEINDVVGSATTKFCGGFFNPTDGESTNTAITTTSFEIRVVTASSFTYTFADKNTWPNGFSLDYTLA